MTPSQIVAEMVPDSAAASALDEPFQQYSFDLEKAKDELAQSSHPDGFTAQFEYYSPAGKVVGLSLAENLKKIGVTLQLESRRLNDYIGDLFVGKVPDIGFFSIAAVVPDPASWYIYLVGKDNPYNAAHYSTPETEAALDVVNTSTDQDERWAAMTTLTQAMATDVPYIGLAQPNFAFAVGQGATFTRDPDFIDVTSGTWVNYLKSTE